MVTNPQGSRADMREVNRIIAEELAKRRRAAEEEVRINKLLTHSTVEANASVIELSDNISDVGDALMATGGVVAKRSPAVGVAFELTGIAAKLQAEFIKLKDIEVPSIDEIKRDIEAFRNASNFGAAMTARQRLQVHREGLQVGINRDYLGMPVASFKEAVTGAPYLGDTQNSIFLAKRDIEYIDETLQTQGPRFTASLNETTEAVARQTQELNRRSDVIQNAVRHDTIAQNQKLQFIALTEAEVAATSRATAALQDHLEASLADAAARVDAGLKVHESNEKIAETIAHINSLTRERSEIDERAAQAAAEAAQKMQKVWEDAGREVFGVWENNWKSLLKGNLDAFDGFASGVLTIGKKLSNGILDQIGSSIAQQSSSIFSALLGGLNGNTNGGLFGLINGTGFTPSGGWSSVFNNPAMSASVLPNFAQSQWGMTLGLSSYGSLTPSQAAAIAANTGVPAQLTTSGRAFNNLTSGWGIAGSLAGSTLSNLLFSPRQGPGSQIGGTIGSVAGSFIPVPFLGTAVGSFIGSTVGGLFGPRPSDRTEGLTFDLASGSEKWGNLGPNKRDPNNENLAKAIHTQVGSFYQALNLAGLKPLSADGLIEVGGGNSLAPFRASLGASGVQSFETQDDAFAFLTRALLDSLEVIPEELQSAVDNFDPANIQTFIDALSAAAPELTPDPSLLKQFMDPITDQLAQAVNPRQFELDKLTEQFARLRAEAEALGATTENLQSIQQLEDIQREQIDARYDAPFNETMETVRSDMARMTDPEQWELDQLRARYEDMKVIAADHADELVEIEAWYGAQRGQIADRYAQEAAREAQALLDQQAARQQAIMDRVVERARATISSDLDRLAEERRIIEESASTYRGILESIKSVQARFASDPRISPVSNQQRLADLMAELNAAYAKAQSGDDEAATEIADLAMAAAEANVAYNASSEEAAQIQSQIATILSNTRSLANSELQIAQFNLDANEAQIDLLQQLLDKMGEPGPLPGTTIDDLNALMAEFGKANTKYNFSGMTSAEIENHAVWRAFETELFDIIGRLEQSGATVSWLKDSLDWAPTEYGTNFDSAARRRVPVLRQRLADFGIPGFARGGRTGNLAIVHPNEMIYTGPPAMVYNARETASMMSGGNVLRELQGIRADIGVLSRTVSISGEDQVAQLSRHDMRLASIESNFSLARARA